MAEASKFDFENVKVNLRVPLNLPSVFAQHAQVQDLGEFVQLSFFEIVVPSITTETSQEEIDAVKEAGLFGNCVSKVTLPKANFVEFVKVVSMIAEGQ